MRRNDANRLLKCWIEANSDTKSRRLWPVDILKIGTPNKIKSDGSEVAVSDVLNAKTIFGINRMGRCNILNVGLVNGDILLINATIDGAVKSNFSQFQLFESRNFIKNIAIKMVLKRPHNIGIGHHIVVI